jgi:hypothetical protein
MPNLPIHLQPGSYLAKNEPYTLRHLWPDDCMVAWGRQSIENGQPKPADRWAFFEVRLREPQTFFTRDGDNFADAEDMAFEHFKRLRACPHHEFERRGFRSGVGFCIHCDLYSPYALEPLESCALCGCTTYFAQRGKKWYCEGHAPEGSFIQADEAEGEEATSEPAECELEVAVAA